MRLLSFLCAACTCFWLASGASAQSETPEQPPPTDPPADQPAEAPPAPTTEEAGTEAGTEESAQSGRSTNPNIVVNVQSDEDEEENDDEEEEEEPPEQSPIDPHELEGQSYYHVGAFVRGIYAPQFIQGIFLWGGRDALNPAAGVFFNYRKDGLNIIAEVWGAGFYSAAFYHGLNETDFETEWVESELSVLFGSLAIMWSIPIASWLAIEIGFGIGFGGVFGGLWRTEAYPDASGSFYPCIDENNPDNTPGHPAAAYCDTSTRNGGEGSYQRQEQSPEPYNFNGGVPPLWFWVDVPRVAIRIKPIRQFQIRVEGGFAAYAFYFGGSLAVGF